MATRSTGLARRGDGGFRVDPWSEIQDMRRSMDDLFGRYFGFTPMDRLFGGSGQGWGWNPNVELYETPDELVFTADLPGFSQDDIQLHVTADSLQVNAQHREGEAPASGDGQIANKDQGSESKAGAKDTKGSGSETTAMTPASGQAPRTYHIQSAGRQSFSFNYSLPIEVDPNKVRATYRNGVLEIVLPKSEQVKPKQVQVRVEG